MAGGGSSSSTPLLQPYHAAARREEASSPRTRCLPAMTRCWSRVWTAASSDPAKTIHALKMAFALALAFLLVLVDSSYKRLGTHAIWAIMTVIVVFEFSIGATFSKGCNRGIGTLSAGLLATLIGQIARIFGNVGHPIVIVVSVFIAGAVVTFAKLWPTLKPYEFGLRTFLLTFSLIIVAEYRGSNPLGTALERFIVILLGACIGILVNVFILPYWAGEDLHKSIAQNFQSVADSLEVCVDEYLRGKTLERVPSKIMMGLASDDPVYKGYRSTLISSSKEESLASFASWELIPHGRFKWKYPWKQYVKVGAVLRHCAYSVVALDGCLRSVIQAPLDVRKLFEDELREVSVQCALVLRKLGQQIEDMHKGDQTTILDGVQHAVECLQQSLYLHSFLLLQQEKSVMEESFDALSGKDVPKVNKPSRVLRARSTNKVGFVTYPHDDQSKRFSKQHSWPSRPVDELDIDKEAVFEERVRVLESASALSLGTFATLLMEVALRLDYVVEAVEELADLAEFKGKEDEGSRDVHCTMNGHSPTRRFG